MPQRVAHTLDVQQEMHSGSVEFAVDYQFLVDVFFVTELAQAALQLLQTRVSRKLKFVEH
jgi:hypothetical protein